MPRMARALALLLGLASLFLGPALAAAGMADRIGITFTFMAEDFIKAARPLDGMVVALEGERRYLDAGEESRAPLGQERLVFRPRAAFHHPMAGRVLRRYAADLGDAQI